MGKFMEGWIKKARESDERHKLENEARKVRIPTKVLEGVRPANHDPELLDLHGINHTDGVI